MKPTANTAGTPKITKEYLIKENARLEAHNAALIRGDMEIRTSLSELLGQFYYEQPYAHANREKKVDVKDWLQISFLMGRLKQDADYSNLINANEDLRRENTALQSKIVIPEEGYPDSPMDGCKRPGR